MAKKRRVYKSILGIPIWAITGISLFLIFSIIYDIVVQDRSTIRYIMLGTAFLILLISVGIHLVPLDSIRRTTRRQFGG